jgi:Heparinase II/III-like protein/Heparinase II/III N-terminus
VFSKLKKLRGRSFDELRVRGHQALSAFSESHGWSTQTKVPTEHRLRNLLTSPKVSASDIRETLGTSSSFFAGMKDKRATIDALTSRWPESPETILRKADQIRSGQFDLLGYKSLSFGDPIDWHLEPVAGKRAPLVHWSQFNELDASSYGDQKIVRELGRHQYFICLGQAYWLTGDERYAEVFANHIASWMDQNPPKVGTHWGSSLEIAFRSISWLWSFYFFKDSPALRDEVFSKALSFLYLNARHLETYLSTYFSPNTHLTGEALGLFYIGTLLSEFREALRWKVTGRQILLDQLPLQVRPDGVYFEQSSYYHRYTADIYTHFLILNQNSGRESSSEVRPKLESLMEHLMYITRPDGTTPIFGDDDGGRLMFFDSSEPNDFRAVLSNGAALFRRADFKFVAGGPKEDTLWLLGVEGLREFDQLTPEEPAKKSIGFVDSGYYVMRDEWTPAANYLLFDAGLHGGSSCGHAHADALSIEVAAKGRTLLVDPGTYTYTGSADLRDWFRSSMAHNTVTIDDESSSVAGGPFAWSSIAQSRCLKWITKDRFDFVSGTHNGYSHLPYSAEHIRNILFLKGDYWLIRDEISADRSHQVKLWLHFASGIVASVSADQTGSSNIGEPGLDIKLFATTGAWNAEKAWVSNCYGSKEEAAVFVFSTDAPEMVTFLLPRVVGSPSETTVRAVETIGGKGYEVAHAGGVDIVMLKDESSEQVETARLASDFCWTWARFSAHDETSPTELLLMAGTTLHLQGKRVLRTSMPLDYLVARRVEDQFTVESDHGVMDLRLPASDFATAFSRLSDYEVSN